MRFCRATTLNPLAELEHELLKMVDDGLLEVTLVPMGALLQAEEFQDERILHDVLWSDDFLALVGEREDNILVAAGGQAIVKVGSDLALEFTARPAFAGGFGFVE